MPKFRTADPRARAAGRLGNLSCPRHRAGSVVSDTLQRPPIESVLLYRYAANRVLGGLDGASCQAAR